MPRYFFIDSRQLHPFAEVTVAGVVEGQLEDALVVIVPFRLTYQTDEGVVQRDYDPTAITMPFVFCCWNRSVFVV